jgi:hypothetical protein
MSNRDVGSLSLGWADKDENVSGRSLRVDGRFFEAQQDRNQLARPTGAKLLEPRNAATRTISLALARSTEDRGIV